VLLDATRKAADCKSKVSWSWLVGLVALLSILAAIPLNTSLTSTAGTLRLGFADAFSTNFLRWLNNSSSNAYLFSSTASFGSLNKVLRAVKILNSSYEMIKNKDILFRRPKVLRSRSLSNRISFL
jgi:hypothetical protein